MKTLKKLLFGALIVFPLLLPTRSKAGGLDDFFHWLFGNDKKNHKREQSAPTSAKGNSVPINGGLVVLFAAGLALGAKVIYDKKKQAETAVI
jgi:hypothetical protein